MPSYHIRLEPTKRLVDLLIEDDRGQRWEYGIPYDKRGGFAFEDIEAIRREFGEEFGRRLWTALEEAIARRP
jgi:hypothetical protein